MHLVEWEQGLDELLSVLVQVEKGRRFLCRSLSVTVLLSAPLFGPSIVRSGSHIAPSFFRPEIVRFCAAPDPPSLPTYMMTRDRLHVSGPAACQRR